MEQITLSGRELMDHVFIDDFNGNKMKVKTHEVIRSGQKPPQQLSLLLYQQSSSGQHVVFLFAVYNGEYEGIQGDGEQNQILVKKSYIFVRKSKKDMITIFQSMCRQHILYEQDSVLILKNMRHLEEIRFDQVRNYQFAEEDSQLNADGMEEEQRNKFIGKPYPHIDVKLTMCKPADQCKINFVPIIYQEKQQVRFNSIMVFDIQQNNFTEILSIAPSPENADQLYEDANCFNKFMICRTSDVYEDGDR